MKMSLDVNIEPEEFNTSELHNCIHEVAKLKGIEDFEYQVEFACEKHESYVANIFRVIMKQRGKDKNFSVILKTLVNTTRQELFQELHKREVYVYKEVFPVFKQLQDNIAAENRVIIPISLYSNVETDKEILVLEDLSLNGFAVDNKLERFEPLDYLQVRLVISELAKFHGLSFALEKTDPNCYRKFSTDLNDIIFNETFLNKSKLKSYFNDSFKSSLKVVKSEEAKNKLEKAEPKLLDLLRKHVKPMNHNVLCHGDCWINNVLFRHKAMQNSQVCFLDFQAMRYANPATDIVYFLYLCTNSEFRHEYYNTLLYVYYESLNSYLRQFDMDLKNIYPKEEFETDVKNARVFGFVMALIDMKQVTTALNDDENESTTVKFHANYKFQEQSGENDTESESKISEENDTVINRNMLFNIRINDVVNESIKNGVLDLLVNETSG